METKIHDILTVHSKAAPLPKKYFYTFFHSFIVAINPAEWVSLRTLISVQFTFFVDRSNIYGDF